MWVCTLVLQAISIESAPFRRRTKLGDNLATRCYPSPDHSGPSIGDRMGQTSRGGFWPRRGFHEAKMLCLRRILPRSILRPGGVPDNGDVVVAYRVRAAPRVRQVLMLNCFNRLTTVSLDSFSHQKPLQNFPVGRSIADTEIIFIYLYSYKYIHMYIYIYSFMSI